MKGTRITLALFLLAIFAGLAGGLIAQQKAPQAQATFIYNTTDQVTIDGTVRK